MADQFLGEIRIFSGNYAPMDWLLCNGAILPVSQYSALFSLLGTYYGGDGNTTFKLPDFRGRIPIHQGQGPGLSNRTMGQKGGEEDVSLTVQQLPGHGHVLMGKGADAEAASPQGNSFANTIDDHYLYRDAADAAMTALVDNTLEEAGSGEAHSNIMPYTVINFIIAYNGVYPTRK